MPVLSDRVGTFTDSVIRRMTRINNQYDSINLSQGFPDFDPPKQLLDALAETAYKGPHQYAVTFGAQNFRSHSRYPEPCNVFMSMTELLSVRVNLLPKWIRAITNFSYRRSKPNI